MRYTRDIGVHIRSPTKYSIGAFYRAFCRVFLRVFYNVYTYRWYSRRYSRRYSIGYREFRRVLNKVYIR